MAAEQAGFGFFWINAQDSTSSSRKEIRSWVTSVQHSRRRNHGTVRRSTKLAPRLEESGATTSSPSPSSSSSSSGALRRPRKRAAAISETQSPTEYTPFHSRSSTQRPRKFIKRTSPTDRDASTLSDSAVRAMILAAYVLGTDSSTLLSNRLQDKSDPLRTYADRLELKTSTLWTHYLWQEREHGRLFKAQYGQFGNRAPVVLHPMILNNTAMLSTTVLFTACHLRYMQGITVMTPELLRVRSLAYIYVQAAVDDKELQLDDATFLSIIKLALWEVFFGQWSAYQIHMEGIAQMIRLRGGLGSLGPGGYVGHILRWFDANLSAVAGTPSFIAGEASSAGIRSLETDIESFLLGVKPLELSHRDES